MTANRSTAEGTFLPEREARLAVDIGGTFTDVAIESDVGGERVLTVAKTLTTADAPEQGVLAAIAEVLPKADLEPRHVSTMIYAQRWRPTC